MITTIFNLIKAYLGTNYRLVGEIVLALIAIISMYLVISSPRYAEKKTETLDTSSLLQGTTIGSNEDVIITDTIKKKDGTIKIHKEEHKKKEEVTTVVAKTTTKDTKSDTKYLSRYSLDITQDFPNYNLNQKYTPVNTRMTLGARLGNLPVFGLVGTTGDLKTISLGVRVEF